MNEKVLWSYSECENIYNGSIPQSEVMKDVVDGLFGLYLAVEHVDNEFVEARFDPGEGDLYKAEMGSDLLWKGDSIDNYYPSLELKTNKDTTDHSVLLAMLNELNNESDK